MNRAGWTIAASLALAGTPGLAAPARDGHLATMATRLFPTVAAGDTAMLAKPATAAVARMLAERRRRIDACAETAACVVAAAAWREDERDVLVRSAAPAARDDVRREIDGLDNILQVYGIGRLPPYPLIDGSDELFGSDPFKAKVADAVVLSATEQADPSVAGDRSLALALALLDVNDDDQAIAFEPLDPSQNAAALARARTIDWSRYRYTAIIALGIGPDDLLAPLSPKGKLNVRLAADRLAEGLAPFIIVSGAAVHPRGTTHVEAIEMRRALIDRYGIPADRIVVEPYARHTTTNLRNATRRLIAMGAPLDRDTLIVSNPAHVQTVSGADFVARNRRELGYQPGAVGQRLSPNDVTFRPSRLSLRVDPADPLDP